ncbi:alpha/beta hydrolase family protein [Robiginitalea marina]|uniref:Prolyl oligopeptidase family serine peptidase n=1 Tax=Robiginitalea marina TaxID=2954105 RepID=A0ABT1AWI3_9FLAO|nr:prolyl oligopeptidase family serine peptidase [Robiginitalea marina]MCO5724367.1 prolyl oligopeptidase family serine peptidase [Robiginitalea marina]
MKFLIPAFFLLASVQLWGQKKILDHTDFDLWNTIEQETLSPDGTHVMYSLERGEADRFLFIKKADATPVLQYDRARDGRFTHDSRYAVFSISAWKDSVLAMKRRKVKKKDLPLDSLGIFDLADGRLERIGRIKSFKVPDKWSGFIAWQYEPENEKPEKEKDTTPGNTPKKTRKPGKETGYPLVVRELATGRQDTFHFVTGYTFAKKGKRLAFSTSGNAQEPDAALHVLDLEKDRLLTVHQGRKARYYQVGWSDSGEHLGFVTDEDTTKVQLRPTRLYYWNEKMDRAEILAGPKADPRGLQPSRYADLHFSKDESRMYFGLAPPPVLKDTALAEEEIVNVEVWTYDEPRLYTVQEMQVKADTTRAYTSVFHVSDGKIRQLADPEYPEVELGAEGNAHYALLSTQEPYALQSQWTGLRARDYALVDLRDGSRKKIIEGVAGQVELSPEGSYVYGYHLADSTWFAYHIADDRYIELTRGRAFYDELHDSPSHPWPYGLAGWTKGDRGLVLYDRYDLWQFDPKTGKGERLTRGRETRTQYRYIKQDPEARALDPKQEWLLRTFGEDDKAGGFASLNPGRSAVAPLLSGPYHFGTPVRAEQAPVLLWTRESFREFPDLWASGPDFQQPTRISVANPQQEAYAWGSIEQVKWTSLDGMELTGLLVKPEGFDPSRKYPMIVNFYEKSSEGLYRHRAPAPGRSTINYSFYASRGYLIFNPDIQYRTGYPGESAYNCVIPGVTSLIEKGFVDPERIGLQGHSWGGYQIAYLVTRSNLFRAAEAGAPVPNMISAYGGIRWQTGLSRQFQYEHTQSRIGGTPWEFPMRYLENSPIFTMDKVETPLLIMHNDADGHVPWYQGIEMFMSLRRLGKPAWLLNYNGEPHWPLKRQNREDFNIRMAQFFDHYLKGAPLPVWMQRGVPAVEKGIRQGYELTEPSAN